MDIVIRDDMPVEANKLSDLIKKLYSKLQIHIFYKAADVLEYIFAGGAADVCFMDIVMPETDGINLAKKLRSFGYSKEIVFLTAINNYAAESYSVDAFSYILKPPTLNSVSDVINCLRDLDKKKDKGLVVNSAGAVRFIPFCSISFIEALQRKVLIKLEDNQEIISNSTFNEVSSKILCDTRFVQCHRSYVINMEYILEISGRNIIMCDSTIIPISKSFLEVKKVYLKWLFKEGKNER